MFPGYTPPPPEDETPEARLYRETREQQQADEDTVERLLRSLKPEDARMHLFSWETMVRWAIPRRFRRI